MLQVVLGHQFVGDGLVLAVPEFLEVAPDELLVGLRHHLLLQIVVICPAWPTCVPRTLRTETGIR
jgi:hypothetical protein